MRTHVNLQSLFSVDSLGESLVPAAAAAFHLHLHLQTGQAGGTAH